MGGSREVNSVPKPQLATEFMEDIAGPLSSAHHYSRSSSRSRTGVDPWQTNNEEVPLPGVPMNDSDIPPLDIPIVSEVTPTRLSRSHRMTSSQSHEPIIPSDGGTILSVVVTSQGCAHDLTATAARPAAERDHSVSSSAFLSGMLWPNLNMPPERSEPNKPIKIETIAEMPEPRSSMLASCCACFTGLFRRAHQNHPLGNASSNYAPS